MAMRMVAERAHGNRRDCIALYGGRTGVQRVSGASVAFLQFCARRFDARDLPEDLAMMATMVDPAPAHQGLIEELREMVPGNGIDLTSSHAAIWRAAALIEAQNATIDAYRERGYRVARRRGR